MLAPGILCDVVPRHEGVTGAVFRALDATEHNMERFNALGRGARRGKPKGEYGLSKGMTLLAGAFWGIVSWIVMLYAVMPMIGFPAGGRGSVLVAIIEHAAEVTKDWTATKTARNPPPRTKTTTSEVVSRRCEMTRAFGGAAATIPLRESPKARSLG